MSGYAADNAGAASRAGRIVRAAFRLAFVAAWCCGGFAHAAQLAWQSGFDNGFPGAEWLDYDNGSYSPAGSMPEGRVSARTIVNRQSGEPMFGGDHAYKGWIAAPAADSHRAYPVIHADISTPLVNTFYGLPRHPLRPNVSNRLDPFRHVGKLRCNDP